MTETATTEVNQALLPAIPPRLQEAGITIRDDGGYRTLGIPPALRDKFNIIFPTVELSQQSPDFWPTIREMRLVADVDSYAGASHHKNDECSLNKSGLYKLAEAAKIDIATERIPTTHLGPTERCGWRAVARQRHSDGVQTEFTSSATFDNEAERLQIEAQGQAGTVEARWRTKIQKASELTETIAIERAIRGVLKLPHKLKKTELAKPWLVVCYAFIPTSAEGRAAAATAMTSLFGGDRSAPALAAPEPYRELAAGEVDPTPPPAAAEAPDLSDEPAIEEEGEVENLGEGEIINDPELDALAEQAASTKPPLGTFQDKTLEQIVALRPASDAWLKWAAAKDWSGADENFGRLVTAYVTKNAADLLPPAEATE